MLVTFVLPAPSGVRWPQRDFDLMVGQKIPIMVPGPVTGIGVLERAVVTDGGAAAEVTPEVPEDSEPGRAVTIAAGGVYGHVRIHEDGTAGPLVLLRRDPAEAARRIREGFAAKGFPADLADAMIAEMQAEGSRSSGG
jgi:hypothetical protein